MQFVIVPNQVYGKRWYIKKGMLFIQIFFFFELLEVKIDSSAPGGEITKFLGQTNARQRCHQMSFANV